MLHAAFADLTADQLLARLDAAGIANARLRGVPEFAEHPQLAARDRWRAFHTAAGPLRGLLPPVTVPGREARMGAVPALGAHTEAIRAEFGQR